MAVRSACPRRWSQRTVGIERGVAARAAQLSSTGPALVSPLLRGRAAGWFSVALAALAGALTLDVGLATDDYAHQQFVRSHLMAGGTAAAAAVAEAPWDMFDVGGRGGPLDIALRVYAGILPWWTSPRLQVAFFRPLAVATHFLDGALWPDAPWLMHLHNALWYVALVILVGVYLRRAMGDGSVARAAPGLAVLLYAVDEAHVEGLAWIASRNTLMAACFAVGALVAHQRGRAEGRFGYQLIAALSLALGLASGEGAIAAWPYLIGHALFVDRGAPAARLLALAPLAAVTAAWQLLYRALGYGARGSGVYLDPSSDPVAFLAALPGRASTALQEQLAVPGWMDQRVPAPFSAALDLATLVLLLLAVVPLWRLLAARPHARMLAFGMLGSVLPICAIPPAPRLLFLVGVGGAALLAELIVEALQAIGTGTARRRSRSRAPAALALGLLALHAIAAPLAARSRALTHADNERAVRRVAASLPRGDLGGASLVILHTDNSFLTQLALMRHTQSAAGRSAPSHLLGAGVAPVRLTRRSASVVVLTPQGGYLRGLWSQIVRSPREPFTPGQRVPLSIGSATVEAVTSDGRPARLRLELTESGLPTPVFLAWDRARRRFARVTLPKVGSSVQLGGT